MKKSFLLLFAIALMLTSCREKDLDMSVLNKSLFTGADFTEINLSDAWNVTIIQDNENTGVELEYSAYLETYLNVKQANKALTIGLNQHFYLPYNTVMRAVIHVKTLDKLVAKDAVKLTLDGAFTASAIAMQLEDATTCKGGSFAGNANISIDDASQLADCTIEGSYCELQVKDASYFKGNLTADSIYVEIEDAGHLITYGGQVQRVRLNLSDASTLNMVNTPVEEAFVDIHDASEATLHVNQLLKGSLKDASTLYYKGHPVIDLDSDSTSSLKPL